MRENPDSVFETIEKFVIQKRDDNSEQQFEIELNDNQYKCKITSEELVVKVKGFIANSKEYFVYEVSRE